MITNIEKASELFKPIEVSESGTYIVSWDYSDITEDEMKFKNSAFVPTGKKILTGRGKWKTIYFSSKPSFYSLQNKILSEIDTLIKDKILKGFVWNGYSVWLSSENQKNYSDWYNLAKSTDKIFPLTAKFNKNGKTIYYEFTTLNELEDLYIKMTKYINDTVNYGRKMKDNINWDDYKNIP